MSRPSSRPSAPASGDLLTAENLGYTLPDGRALFRDLTLGFGRERTGLVGANGSGKSTLARLLAGALQPTHGRVIRRGLVGYLPQHVVRDAREMSDVLGDAHAPAALARAGLSHLGAERTVDTLSGGEATRVAFTALLRSSPDVLVLDEPTNDLDRASREALYAFVERWRGGLLVVTHDRALLARVDRILELSALGARLYGGDYDAYVEQRDAEAAAAAHDLADARKTLRTTERVAQAARERQQRRASQGRASARTAGMPRILLGKRAESSQRTTARLQAIGERTVTDARTRIDAARARVEVRERLALAPPSTELRASRTVVVVEAAGYTHPDGGTLLPVTCAVVGPERVAIVGPNGSGKTTLLRLLGGELAPDAGSVRLGLPADRVAYVDQHTTMLRGDWTVLENLRASQPSLREHECRQLLAQYLFRGDAALLPVQALSGGERLRAALACALHGGTQLLLLDEPTNHLDLDALHAVEQMLVAYDGALVVVSHDDTFLDAVGVERRVELTGA